MKKKCFDALQAKTLEYGGDYGIGHRLRIIADMIGITESGIINDNKN